MKHTTEWRKMVSGEYLRVTYGIDYEFGAKHNQASSFSITADLGEKHSRGYIRDIGGGWMHEAIEATFPELAYLIPWHLCALEEGPMHYEANAVCWAEYIVGFSALTAPPTPVKAFKSTVVFGAVKGDNLELPGTLKSWADPNNISSLEVNRLGITHARRAKLKRYVEAWCRVRFSNLMQAFMRDMAQAEVLKPLDSPR